MSKLQDLLFKDILPQSIKEDGIISAASSSLDEILRQTALASTNLLMYSRLGGDISHAMLPALERMANAKGGLKPLSLTELEQLAWQFHVDFREVATTNDELAGMVKNSIAWHRLKGTPASMKMAFALFDLKVEIEEHALGTHWASYQLDLGEVTDISIVKLAWTISQEMQPARCKLFRMYTDEYNITPLIYSEGNYSDHFYSFFSGVSADVIGGAWGDGKVDSDLQLSFGSRIGIESEMLKHFGNALFFGSARTGFEAPYYDYPVWSYFDYSDAFPEMHGFIGKQYLCTDATEKIYSSGTWEDGGWADHPWAISLKWDRPLPEWSMYYASISRSQLVYDDAFMDDDAGTYSGLNACYSVPTATREAKPFIWGDSRYSDDSIDETIIIYEQKFDLQCISTEPLALESIPTTVSARQGFEIPYIDAQIWSYFNYSDAILDNIGCTVQARIGINCDNLATSYSAYCASMSKSQLVYSDSYSAAAGTYSGLNACYSMPTATREVEPFIWGDSCYSDSTEGEEIIIHEQKFDLQCISTEPLEIKPLVTTTQRICCATEPLHNITWSDMTWEEAGTWYDYIAWVAYDF